MERETYVLSPDKNRVGGRRRASRTSTHGGGGANHGGGKQALGLNHAPVNTLIIGRAVRSRVLEWTGKDSDRSKRSYVSVELR